MEQIDYIQTLHTIERCLFVARGWLVYKIPYRRARAWPLGRVLP